MSWGRNERGNANMADAIVELPYGTVSTFVDAERALKNIAVAEAAETLAERAKDATQLFEAIKIKLFNQAAYAVWRQDVKPPSQTIGGPGRGIKGTTEQSSLLPATDPGDKTIERWRAKLCKKIAPNQWCMDDIKLKAALDDAKMRCLRICEQENMGTIRGTEGTGEFERYTPAFYIEKARDVLGTIDLDPASSEYAQKTVQAEEHFTVEDDGLAQDWHGRIWLNPPYHRELAPKFIEKLLEERDAGHVVEAIVLTNNSTDTAWFVAAATYCDAICFTTGRINFEVPNSKPVLPTQGQAFFYFGPRDERQGAKLAKFVEVFAPIGLCLEPLLAAPF